MERNKRALQVAVRCYSSKAFWIKLDSSTRADKTFQIVHFLAFNQSADVSKIIHLQITTANDKVILNLLISLSITRRLMF